jgi:hypothetical protein
MISVLDPAEILEQSMGAPSRVGIGLSYRPASYIGWRNRFLGSLEEIKSYKTGEIKVIFLVEGSGSVSVRPNILRIRIQNTGYDS